MQESPKSSPKSATSGLAARAEKAASKDKLEDKPTTTTNVAKVGEPKVAPEGKKSIVDRAVEGTMRSAPAKEDPKEPSAMQKSMNRTAAVPFSSLSRPMLFTAASENSRFFGDSPLATAPLLLAKRQSDLFDVLCRSCSRRLDPQNHQIALKNN